MAKSQLSENFINQYEVLRNDLTEYLYSDLKDDALVSMKVEKFETDIEAHITKCAQTPMATTQPHAEILRKSHVDTIGGQYQLRSILKPFDAKTNLDVEIIKFNRIFSSKGSTHNFESTIQNTFDGDEFFN